MIKPKYYFTIGPVIYTGVNCYLTIININWKYINIATTIFYFITHIITTLSISEILDIIHIKSDNITCDNIIARNPLSNNAKRAGWQGCNLHFTKIHFITPAF